MWGERFLWKDDLLVHWDKWNTVEQGISYLRELAVLEVIVSNNEQFSTNPDNIQCTQNIAEIPTECASVTCQLIASDVLEGRRTKTWSIWLPNPDVWRNYLRPLMGLCLFSGKTDWRCPEIKRGNLLQPALCYYKMLLVGRPQTFTLIKCLFWFFLSKTEKGWTLVYYRSVHFSLIITYVWLEVRSGISHLKGIFIKL